jgi:hypothetical protein
MRALTPQAPEALRFRSVEKKATALEAREAAIDGGAATSTFPKIDPQRVLSTMVQTASFAYYVTQIPESVRMQMRSVTGHYRNDFSKTTQSFYWMNHCEHCGMKQGDFELFEEFDTPFCPINP